MLVKRIKIKDEMTLDAVLETIAPVVMILREEHPENNLTIEIHEYESTND